VTNTWLVPRETRRDFPVGRHSSTSVTALVATAIETKRMRKAGTGDCGMMKEHVDRRGVDCADEM
jgi:hypothetical protein